MKLQDIPSALSAIADEGRFRRVEDLRMVTASRGIRRDGKEYIVFNSNDYLGMTHESEVMAAARRAVIYGTGSGGARLTSGAVFELSELEKALAAFKHAEDAVIFNTGYMTNLGVLYALAGKGDVIFSDALNHASIVMAAGSQKQGVSSLRPPIWRIWQGFWPRRPAKASASS